MGKHETQGPLIGPDQLGNDRREIMTVRAEAVQPDDCAGRIAAGFDLNGFEQSYDFLRRRMTRSMPATSVPGGGAGSLLNSTSGTGTSIRAPLATSWKW